MAKMHAAASAAALLILAMSIGSVSAAPAEDRGGPKNPPCQCKYITPPKDYPSEPIKACPDEPVTLPSYFTTNCGAKVTPYWVSSDPGCKVQGYTVRCNKNVCGKEVKLYPKFKDCYNAPDLAPVKIIVSDTEPELICKKGECKYMPFTYTTRCIKSPRNAQLSNPRFSKESKCIVEVYVTAKNACDVVKSRTVTYTLDEDSCPAAGYPKP